jgi:hypothetical protein
LIKGVFKIFVAQELVDEYIWTAIYIYIVGLNGEEGSWFQ